MPDYKRIQLPSGAKATVVRVPDGVTVLDEAAVDLNGRPLGPEYPDGPQVVVPDAAASGPAYADWSRKDLEAEVEKRNDARGDEDPPVEVDAPGNKTQLVAALVADDADRANQTPATSADGSTPSAADAVTDA